MHIKRHECKLTEKMVRQIEYVLPKLKYSVYINQVKTWLENFEESEVNYALDFLFYLEYIPFSELQLRLNQQLDLLNKHFGNNKNYLLIPYAKYPKSNDIIMYLITKCPFYKKLVADKRIDITFDIENYKLKKDVVLVYVDDFIGTGKSFKKWYKKNNIENLYNRHPRPYEEQAILAAIIMEDGFHIMTHTYTEIKIFAERRSKIFSSTNSPFNLLENRTEMRRLCLKYGNNIKTRFHLPNKVFYDPLGFDNSEALVAFDYGTPNNSLSIIWGDNEWKPIFPRSGKSRMKKASEIKTEAAFYLGLMQKLDLDFNNDIEMTIDNQDIHLNARDDHSILVYLILIDKLYSSLQICQVLGITVLEFDKIVLKTHKKKLVNRTGELTRRGIKFLSQLKKEKNIRKFRENDAFKLKDNNIFVPKSFRKMT